MNESSPPPWTKSRLMQALEARGFRPSRKRGQNFLIDANLVRFIAEAGAPDSADCVLEIGAGPGNLTRELADRAGLVVAVEVEPRLCEVAEEYLAGRANVRLLCRDALAKHGGLDDNVRGALGEAAARGAARRLKMIANLPYSLGTAPIMAALTAEPAFERIVVLVQREVADRLGAAPGTKEYGAAAVMAQALARVRTVRTAPPEVFWPRPAVASALVEIMPFAPGERPVSDPRAFFDLLGQVFRHRRKMLGTVLRSVFPEAALTECGIDSHRRLESVDVETIVRFVERLLKTAPVGGNSGE